MWVARASCFVANSPSTTGNCTMRIIGWGSEVVMRLKSAKLNYIFLMAHSFTNKRLRWLLNPWTLLGSSSSTAQLLRISGQEAEHERALAYEQWSHRRKSKESPQTPGLTPKLHQHHWKLLIQYCPLCSAASCFSCFSFPSFLRKELSLLVQDLFFLSVLVFYVSLPAAP